MEEKEKKMKEKIIKALEKAKSNSKPRKFTQSWEIAINLWIRFST